MACKWLINEGDIIIGTVDYHSELLGQYRTKDKTIGGGLWHWDKINNIVYFYGSSLDFGGVTKQQFDTAWQNSLISPSIEDCEIVFSERVRLSDVIADHQQTKIKDGH